MLTLVTLRVKSRPFLHLNFKKSTEHLDLHNTTCMTEHTPSLCDGRSLDYSKGGKMASSSKSYEVTKGRLVGSCDKVNYSAAC